MTAAVSRRFGSKGKRLGDEVNASRMVEEAGPRKNP